MNLIWIVGPPAVGKMTVGMALSERTGMPLFHNHMPIELVLPIFPFGSPPFKRLVESFRNQIFEEVAKSDLPGLIGTIMIHFDRPDNWAKMTNFAAPFTTRGAKICWVELVCDLEERLRRNRTELRLQNKPSKRDVSASEQRLLGNERKMLNSDGEVPFPEDWLRIDNTQLSAEAVAQLIIDHFEL